MNLGEMIDEFRVLSQDNVAPYFCGPNELIKWFNDAEEEAAIRARLIHDSEELTVAAGETRIALPKGAFEILYIELRDASGTFFPICVSTRDVLDAAMPGWRRRVERPEFVVVDDTEIVLGAVPDADYALYVEFFRTPRAQLADVDDTPEIHLAHHEGLIQWVLHKAFGKPDADLFDPVKSKDAESAFVRQFGKRPTADLRKRQNANRPHRNRLHT